MYSVIPRAAAQPVGKLADFFARAVVRRKGVQIHRFISFVVLIDAVNIQLSVIILEEIVSTFKIGAACFVPMAAFRPVAHKLRRERFLIHKVNPAAAFYIIAVFSRHNGGHWSAHAELGGKVRLRIVGVGQIVVVRGRRNVVAARHAQGEEETREKKRQKFFHALVSRCGVGEYPP